MPRKSGSGARLRASSLLANWCPASTWFIALAKGREKFFVNSPYFPSFEFVTRSRQRTSAIPSISSSVLKIMLTRSVSRYWSLLLPKAATGIPVRPWSIFNVLRESWGLPTGSPVIRRRRRGGNKALFPSCICRTLGRDAIPSERASFRRPPSCSRRGSSNRASAFPCGTGYAA